MAKAPVDLKALKARRDTAASDRQRWDAIYRECYDYVMPYRRPVGGTSGKAKGEARTDHLFDLTGTVSAFKGAGQLQSDLFPPGQGFFKLVPGPVTKMVLKRQAAAAGAAGDPRDEAWFQRQLDDVTDQLAPFFRSGEWDNAVSELCLDLYVGTGIMLMLAGDRTRPIRFVTLPLEEVAIEPGPYGDVSALFWCTRMTRRAIAAAFPKGDFPRDFAEMVAEGKGLDDEVELHQDFWRTDKGTWQLVVTLEKSETPVASETYRTQPFIAPRFHRVPGETYGRGPALLALPSIKTLNKAMEITLKAAAIQMLGIWGYRPGGAFNPDTIRLAPGQFWPMAATGGIMGADVARLDTSAGRVDVGSIVLQELRSQVKQALHDYDLPDGGLTPKSAAEVLARVSRAKQAYVGAFGRMIHEIIPVVIPRVIEVLWRLRLIVSDIQVDQLLVAIDVLSPLAQALKADAHKTTVEAMQLVAMLEGAEGVQRRFKLDDLLPAMIRDLGVQSQYVRTVQELGQFDQASAQAAQAASVGQALLDKPKDFAEVAGVMPGQQQDQAAA